MPSHLLNVRLDADRLRKARRLRDAGIVLSEVVRTAIDARFETLERSFSSRDAALAVSRVLERFPNPPGLGPREYDVHDARQARAAVGRGLRRRGR